MLTDTKNTPYVKVKSLDHQSVEWTKGLWADSYAMCANSMVPQLKGMFDAKDVSHVVENFKICAGDETGDHDGTVFGDGDFYKWMESAIYTGSRYDNKELMDQVDDYIDLIGRAQLPDGYLSTKQIIGEMQDNGISRMGDINDFEVYNFGHLFTTACLHKRVTGKDSLMKIAVKTADYLEQLYKESAETGQVQTAVCPSHYMGLVEMYRTTGDEKYKHLAEMAVELRDSVEDGTDDNQDRIPLKEHDKIVGHAVRANYLYAGVADLYAETGDKEYLDMLHKVWKSLMDHKFYITGGCGALYNGVSPYGNFFLDQKTHQSYGYEYQLPNTTAYNETCASIGLVMWAYRMFNVEQKVEYIDIIERTMLNTNLAAVSLDGRKFFYENMLRRSKELEYELVWPLSRTEYIISYCCPPNLARNIAQSSEYVYAVTDSDIYTLMYGGNKATFKLDNGAAFTLEQETDYPYDGRIDFKVTEVEKDAPVKLMIRIPGWLESGQLIKADGQKVLLGQAQAGTYMALELDSLMDAGFQLVFDMKPRLTIAHGMVEENTNQAAVEKGPLVYCIESVDADMETLDDLLISPDVSFENVEMDIEGRRIMALEGELPVLKRQDFNRTTLYQTLNFQGIDKKKVRMIPYFAWDNRDFGEMKIWLPLHFNY